MVKSLLTKICSVCGLSKPLTAFLVMNDKQGATYGNICSACRKTAMEKSSLKEGESTTSSTGKTITSKEKAQWDLETEKEKLKLQREYYEERGEKEKEQS